MADKQEAPKKDEKPAAPDAASKSKKPLMIGVGAIVVAALGVMGSMFALPKAHEAHPTMKGPFIAKLSKTDLSVNLAGEGSKRYLVMALNAEYFSYDEKYVNSRIGEAGGEHGGSAAGDPLFGAMLQDALLGITARKTRDQVTDSAQIEGFLEEVRQAVDPLLFPVCIGDSHTQSEPDSASGLRVGESIMESTMRGQLHEHKLQVDARRRTMRLDDGQSIAFQGTERDLRVENEMRESVYVDTTAFKPEFDGDVPVGIAGKVRRIYREKFLVQ